MRSDSFFILPGRGKKNDAGQISQRIIGQQEKYLKRRSRFLRVAKQFLDGKTLPWICHSPVPAKPLNAFPPITRSPSSLIFMGGGQKKKWKLREN
jgi:hypothetical protein